MKKRFWNEIDEKEILKKQKIKIKTEKIYIVNKLKSHKKRIKLKEKQKRNKRFKNKRSEYIKPNKRK